MSQVSGKWGKRFFKAGGCYNGEYIDEKTNFVRCALSRDECSEGLTFVGHRDICEPNDMKVGRCLQEDTCAARASDCAESKSIFNFSAEDASCTIQRDHTKVWDVQNPQFTQFGSCYNKQDEKYFCIFLPSDCEESGKEVYLTPSETLANGISCDCSKVHVTGCVSPGLRANCAVRDDGCDDEDEMRSPHFQRSDRELGINGLDCILCSKVNTAIPTISPSTSIAPTFTPTESSMPTKFPSESPAVIITLPPTASPFIDNIPNHTDNRIIIGASIGGGLAAALTAGFIFIMIRRSSKHAPEERNKNSRPMREISW